MVTLVSELQPSNAELPMLVTLFGMVTLVSEVQPMNAPHPMLVTLSGMVMLVSDWQSWNAYSAIPIVSERSKTVVILVSQSIAHLPRYNTPFSQLEELL